MFGAGRFQLLPVARYCPLLGLLFRPCFCAELTELAEKRLEFLPGYTVYPSNVVNSPPDGSYIR
eukprot:2427873-Rhodomonas_salina.1